jgi:outer membrane lipoprotein SlyB
MLRNSKLVAILAVITVGLSACYAPPPHQTVVYRDDYPQQHYQAPPPSGYHEAPPPSGYQAPPPPTDQSGVCHTCGTVRGFDQVALSQPNTGGGAVLGAIIGGLIGNQFGGGSGKAAATAAGVVGGAVVGNSVEQHNAYAHSGYAWRYRVELDDGRWATVTQVDNPGFRRGDRVAIRGDHIEWMR